MGLRFCYCGYIGMMDALVLMMCVVARSSLRISSVTSHWIYSVFYSSTFSSAGSSEIPEGKSQEDLDGCSTFLQAKRPGNTGKEQGPLSEGRFREWNIPVKKRHLCVTKSNA